MNSTLSRDSEILKPGNYLVATWDCTTLEDVYEDPRGVIAQMGAFLPHGVSVVCAMQPGKEECTRQVIDDSGLFVKIRGELKGKCRSGRELMPLTPTKQGLESFLTFLEKGCRSVRPAYDGILLLSHIQEIIPTLIKSMRKHCLYERFSRTVKGMGDLCTFLAQCHLKRFARGTDAGRVDLAISAVSLSVLGERTTERSSCDRKAKTTYEVLERLLETPPTYSNFFSRFVHPLDSRLIHRLSSFRTPRERVEACLPLRMFVARELAEQQGELIVDGVYAPDEDDTGGSYLSQPQQVSLAVCKLLVSANLDFEQLLKVYRDQGLTGVELKLRSAFLCKMSGQSRAIVDQTVRTTRLIVSFFRQHGDKSFETMMLEAKEEAEKELATARDQKNQGAEMAMMQPSDPDLRQSEYVKMFESFKPVSNHLTRRLSRRSNIMQGKSAEDLKVVVDMLINSLIMAKIDHDRLVSMYLKDRQSFQHRGNFYRDLTCALAGPYRQHGPVELKVNQFVDLIVDYCATNVHHHQPQQQQQSDRQLLSKENLESARVALDMAIHESTRAFSELTNFRTRLLSLSAVKDAVVRRLEPTVAMCGGAPEQAEQLGAHAQKLLALTGFHHVTMRQTFQLSETALSVELQSALEKRSDLLPPGVGAEIIAESVVEYFKGYQSAVSG